MSSNSLTPRRICSLCRKSRSKRYHDQYPLLLGQVPEHGICSRPNCAKALNEMLRPPCPVIIHEIHYHYHSSPGPEGPPPTYTAAKLRLPGNTLDRDLSPIREESPPSMNVTSGPEENTPYTTAEISGESSLNGRVELPDNRCSRRHMFRKVSRVSEEFPPPVNFLKKPTLQKKK